MKNLERIRRRAETDAKTHGYYLHPDRDFLKGLLEGLKRNEERYGYPSCPCRLASGDFELDRDIICPCDYRSPDVEEFGVCYCSLYVNKDVFEGRLPVKKIPERRPAEKEARAFAATTKTPAEKPSDTIALTIEKTVKAGLKLWYCRQCGYVCFREEPPYICPICKAKREMFAELPSHVGKKV